MGEARQLEDRYGLNPRALVQLRWIVGELEPDEPDPPARRKSSARRRAAITVIDGGGAA